MIAVVVVRRGVLPAGAQEATAEAGGAVLLAGDGVEAAAAELLGARDVTLWEAGEFRPGAWSAALVPVLTDVPIVLLPASPDGRDLAPRLAHALGRPLLANAVRVGADRAVLSQHDGRVAEEVAVGGPVVATLLPGACAVAESDAAAPAVRRLDLPLPAPAAGTDAQVLDVLPADPATVALEEAERIVAGGLGLRGPAAFHRLAEVATALGASLGGTRVAADLGWIAFERQIGTTGAIVHPRLYVALGISGAVQHTSGLGTPEHVIAVNLDPSCPMMALADLPIVTDAVALVDELAARLLEPGAAGPAV